MKNKKQYANTSPSFEEAPVERYEGVQAVRRTQAVDYDERNADNRQGERRRSRPRRRRYGKFRLLLMLLGALALFYLAAKFVIIPLLVFVQMLIGGAA